MTSTIDAMRSAFTLPIAIKRAELTGEDWRDVFVDHVRLLEGDVAAEELAQILEVGRPADSSPLLADVAAQ